MADPPPGPRLKVERAKKHFADLRGEAVAFRGINPDSIVREPDPEGGWRARLDPWPEIPPAMPLILGDLIHNLRSALDIMICDLVRDHRPQDIHDSSGFPVVRDAQHLKAAVPGKVKGARNAVKKAVIRQNPTEAGNPPLWRLHRLNILDKHRLIVPTVVANRSVNVGKVMGATFAKFVGGDPPDITLWVNNATPCGDKDSGVIYRDKSGTKPDYDLELSFDISVNEPGWIDCEPLIPLASDLIDFTEAMVVSFDQYFV